MERILIQKIFGLHMTREELDALKKKIELQRSQLPKPKSWAKAWSESK